MDDLIEGILPPKGESETSWYDCAGNPLTQAQLTQFERELTGATINADGTITPLANHELH